MNNVTGGSLPARTWRAFMIDATRGMPARPLPAAPAIVAQTTAPMPPSRGGASPLQGLLDRLFGGEPPRADTGWHERDPNDVK